MLDYINPLDDLETFLIDHGWPYQRIEDSDILIETGNGEQQFLLRCGYSCSARQISIYCFLGIKCSTPAQKRVLPLINQINEKTPIGAFVARKKEGDVVFRVELPLMSDPTPGEPLFEPVIEMCLQVVEAHLPSIAAAVNNKTNLETLMLMVNHEQYAKA